MATPATWAQDHNRIFLSVKIKGASGAEDPQCNFGHDGSVKLDVAGMQFEQVLWSNLDVEHPDVTVSYKPNSVELTLRKSEKGWWQTLLQGGKKERSIKVDWDKWVDEDECEDNEAEDPQGVSAYDTTDVSREEASVIDGDDSSRFVQLNPNEKMMLLATMWNHCEQEERAMTMGHLKGILDGDEEGDCKSDDLKGSGVLGDRDLTAFPQGVSLPHSKKWLANFAGSPAAEKVGCFGKVWSWCNEEEQRLTMAGLTR